MKRDFFLGRTIYLCALFLLPFAAGALVERYGWLPGSSRRPPAAFQREFEPFWETWHLVQQRYVDPHEARPDCLVRGAIRGMLRELNDVGHNHYLTKDEHDRLESELRGGEGLDGELGGATATVNWRMIAGERIAYVSIRAFNGSVHPQLRTALAQARRSNARGLILDVRGNPGGRVSQCAKVVSEFISEGTVWWQEDARGRCQQVPATPGGSATDLPLCILIDDKTASAAEIFAAALQDHRRATLVGTRTAGTGTIMERFQMSDGSVLMLSIYRWLTPSRRCVWRYGLTPDVEVSDSKPAGVVANPDSDLQMKKALEVLGKQLAPSTPSGSWPRESVTTGCH